MNPDSQDSVSTAPTTQPTPDILPTGVSTQQPIPSTPTELPFTPEVPKPKSKVLPILIIVLVIIGLGSLGYWVYQNYFATPEPTTGEPTPTPLAATDSTANWKVVQGVFWTFKVPTNWNYIKCTGDSTIFLDPKIDKDTTKECNFGGVGYLLVIQRDKLNHQIAVSTTPDPYGMYTTVSSKENIKVDGQNAIEQNVDIYGGQGEGKYIYVYIQKPEFTDILIFSDPSKVELFNQILSTFKFLDQTEGKTANWTTYKSASLNFSIEYPTGWRVVDISNPTVKMVGFGPKQIGEDVLWGVNYYSKPDYTLDRIANDIGTQFSDRKQTKEDITSIGGLPMIKVTTATQEVKDWYHEMVIIEVNTDTNRGFYAISNGAIMDKNLPFDKGVSEGTTFEQFYRSFRITQ